MNKTEIAYAITVAAIILAIVLIAIYIPNPLNAESLMNDVCKELSEDTTSEFLYWGGVSSNAGAPGSIAWTIKCTTGLESIQGVVYG